MTPARLLEVIRWAPVAAAVVYLGVLIRWLPAIVDQLTWNPDYVSQMAIAQWIAQSGLPQRAIVIQIGYFWFDLATAWLPFHRFVWEYAPAALAALTLLLLAGTAWRLSGPFAAALTAALGLGASSLVLSTELAQAYHGATWFGAALLAAYACWLLSARSSRRRIVVVSAVVGVIAGSLTASDPLLAPAGDAPVVAAILVAWRSRPDHVAPRQVASTGLMAVVALLSAGTMVLAGRALGLTSSFPRGLTHFVPKEHFLGNLRQLSQGIFEVAGMPHPGSELGIALGLVLIAGLLVAPTWLILSLRGRAGPALIGVLTFWSASAMFVSAAFLFSDIPADFLDTSARYLVSLFFVAAATVPLWAASRALRGAAVAAPAVLLVIANAAGVSLDARAGAFEPQFSYALSAPMTFLEQHGLRHGYAAYDEASPISFKSDFALRVYPVTELFITPGDTCGPPPLGAICPYAYNSLSDWYRGEPGPSFLLVDPGMVRLSKPPPAGLGDVVAVYQVGRFAIYVYGDDVAAHMRMPARFTRPLL